MLEKDVGEALPVEEQIEEIPAAGAPQPNAEPGPGFLRGLGRAAALVAGSSLLAPGLAFLVTAGSLLLAVYLLRLLGHDAYGFAIWIGTDLRVMAHEPSLAKGYLAAILAGAAALALVSLLAWLLWRGPLWRALWAWVLGVSLAVTAGMILQSRILPGGKLAAIAGAGTFLFAGASLAWVGSGAQLPALSGSRGYFSRAALLGAAFALPLLLCLAAYWMFVGLEDTLFHAGLLAACAAPFLLALVRPRPAVRSTAGAWSYLCLGVVVSGLALGLWYAQEQQSNREHGFIVVPGEGSADRAYALGRRGEQRWHEGDLDGAESDFAELAEREPDAWQGHLGLAMVAAKRGDDEAGIEHLRRAIEKGGLPPSSLEASEELDPLKESEGWEESLALASSRMRPLSAELPEPQVFATLKGADTHYRGRLFRESEWKPYGFLLREEVLSLLEKRATYLRLADSLEDEEERTTALSTATLAGLEAAGAVEGLLDAIDPEVAELIASDLDEERKFEVCWEWTGARAAALERGEDEATWSASGDWLEKQVVSRKGTPCAPAALARLVRREDMETESSKQEAMRLYARFLETVGEEAALPVMVSWHLQRARFLHDGFPDFQLEDLDGNLLSKESLSGKVVLVDFWATWCGPCRREIPNLRDIYRDLGDGDFEIVGISLDDAPDPKDRLRFRLWVMWNRMPWPQHLDGRGWQTPIGEEMEIVGIPTMILLDREGRVVDSKLRGDALRKRIQEILRGDGPA